MKLPNQRRIYTQDFPEEYQDFVTKLAESLNINLEFLYQALNKNISLRDNIACTIREVTVVVDSTGTPASQTTFALDNNLPVLGVTALSTINLTNSTGYPTGQPYVAWEFNNQGKFVIRYISSLTPGNTYRLTLSIWN